MDGEGVEDTDGEVGCLVGDGDFESEVFGGALDGEAFAEGLIGGINGIGAAEVFVEAGVFLEPLGGDDGFEEVF
ncbi:MAG: hypothetical protein RI897_166 [Verrucomicrobiota bacterium]